MDMKKLGGRLFRRVFLYNLIKIILIVMNLALFCDHQAGEGL